MDIFYVQGHLFFHTISRKVQFRTVAPVRDRTKDTLLRETRAVLALYQSRGFNIPDLHTDIEFGCIRNDVLPTQLNVTAAGAKSNGPSGQSRSVRAPQFTACLSSASPN
jgi:hypothetical protein